MSDRTPVASGRSHNRPMREPAGGERRIVTVLLADLVDSTVIAERLGPERSKFLFDEVVRLMGDEVRRYGGTVAQLTGDGLFALFGAPIAHEDDSERAARSALAIHQALTRYAAEVEQAYGVTLSARVGINTGPVVLPGEDAPTEERYNALGDTVNVAARLQELAEAGAVAAGPVTARQVETGFELEPLGEIELKGKSALVSAFKVTGERSVRHAITGPFVGREAELAKLVGVLDELCEERGAIVAVAGEPGIGKSRIVREVRNRYTDRITFLEGHAASYAENLPYWPVRDLLRRWLGLGVSDPEARLRLELKAALAFELGERVDDVYPYLANLLGLSADPEVADRLAGFSLDSVQRQTHEAVGAVLRALSRCRPLCLVLDDLHWADDATLTLVEELLALTDEEAVGLLLLFRNDPDLPAWDLADRAHRRFRHRYSMLELGPLAAAEALQLAGAELPDRVARLLLERAGGNPLFVEEALGDLVERGALRREDGRYELTGKVADAAVPLLVQEALQARLGRLAPDTREIIAAAAVIGQSFGTPLLERVCSEGSPVAALSELQRLELVVEERRRPAPEYRFRHGLVREVAYASLTSSRRRALHRSVAEALEGLHGEDLAEAYGELARHFAEADDPRAAGYLLKAGDAARGMDAENEAIDHYRRALGFLERLGDQPRAREVLLRIGLIHHLSFDFERADSAYAEAFSRPLPEPRRVTPSERIEAALYHHPDALTPGHTHTMGGWTLVAHLFSGLVSVDREQNVVPAVAESFRIAGDGRTYSFALREDARWSDGTPVTAYDFAYTWDRMQAESVRASHLLESIAGATALDERLLEVRLDEPQSYLLHLLAGSAAFPWPRHRCEALGDEWRSPNNLVGNGPFALAEYDDEHALMTARPGWHLRRGNVREIHWDFVELRDAQLENWLAGSYDAMFTDRRAPADAPETRTESIPVLQTSYVAFGTRPPFDDVRVRKAFAHAIDRAQFVEATSVSGEPAENGGLLPPAMPAHSHKAGLRYDLDIARHLLADAGYPDGRGLPDLAFVTDFRTQAENLAAQWGELGATVKVGSRRELDHRSENTHMLLYVWGADYPDPDAFLSSIGRLVPIGPDQQLLRQARSLPDRKARIRLYNEVERLWIAEEAALLPLVYPRSTLFTRPWLVGVWANTVDFMRLEQAVVIPPPDRAQKPNA
jgi:ABC-type transport system substrate-binding protein/class 3 adenylate cyclase